MHEPPGEEVEGLEAELTAAGGVVGAGEREADQAALVAETAVGRRGPGHVPEQSEQAVRVAGGDAKRVVDAEAGVVPSEHGAGGGVGEEPSVREEVEDPPAKEVLDPLEVAVVDGDGEEAALGREDTVGDEQVEVGGPGELRGGGLDHGDDAWSDVVSGSGRPEDVKQQGRGDTGQLPEQGLVVQEEGPDPLRQREDPLAMRDLGRDLVGFGLAATAGVYAGTFYTVIASHGLHVGGGLATLPWAAAACPVCFAPEPGGARVYLGTTIGLSLLPLAIIAGLVWWLLRSLPGADRTGG